MITSLSRFAYSIPKSRHPLALPRPPTHLIRQYLRGRPRLTAGRRIQLQAGRPRTAGRPALPVGRGRAVINSTAARRIGCRRDDAKHLKPARTGASADMTRVYRLRFPTTILSQLKLCTTLRRLPMSLE
jgi:hypothetical protein